MNNDGQNPKPKPQGPPENPVSPGDPGQKPKPADPAPNPETIQGGWFTTTLWTVVMAARDGDTTTSRKALEHLCSIYWSPIYSFLRREGHQPADAEDLTQGFFAHLLEQDFLTRLRHQDGRFRSFLLKFLKNYLSDQRDKANAQKRGGGKVILSLDQMAEEERLKVEPSDGLTPDQVFERRWAQTLMAQTVERLRQRYAATGRSALFERFKDLQPGEHGATSYADLGAELGMTEQAIKSAVLRFRREHREIVREEIAQTLTDPSGIEDEIRHLLTVLAR